MSENLTIKILEVSGIEIAFAYAGLPMGKIVDPMHTREKYFPDQVWADLEKVITRLISLGDEHAKIMRQVVVHMEITAPRYWWQQFATYHAGVEVYSGSTMYTLKSKIPKRQDFAGQTDSYIIKAIARVWDRCSLIEAKAMLPEGFLQTRLVMCSYQTLRRIWLQRRKHKLSEWHEFIESMHELPYCHDLIFVEPRNPWRELWVSLLDDVGILADDKPDTLSVVGLTGAQCDEYTSLVLELLHKENKGENK